MTTGQAEAGGANDGAADEAADLARGSASRSLEGGIEVFDADGVRRLTLARPQRMNALDTAAYAALAQALEGAATDPAVRVVLLEGSASIFCAGNDLHEFLGAGTAGPPEQVLRFMQALLHCDKPVVAAVNGAAVGIGATLLLHCDAVIAADDARFAFPFVNLGICPEFASTYLLPRLAGHLWASEKLLLGEPFGAEEALSAGLVTRLVPPASVREVAARHALRLAAQPAGAVQATKRLLRAGTTAAAQVAIRAEVETFSALLASGESQAAIQAFLARRTGS